MTYLAQEPKILPTFAGLVRPRPKLKGLPTLPEAAWTFGPMRPNPARLDAYRAALGLPESPNLPVLYPHVMSGRMHMAMLAEPSFPIGMLGAVHIGTSVERLAPMPSSGSYGFKAFFEQPRALKRGLEFALVTHVTAGDHLVWKSRNTYFVRGRFGEAQPSTEAALEAPQSPEKTPEWDLPTNLGRVYARVCGDWNPIHISRLSAKLFGFKSSIVHGYANLAMALGRMGVDPDNVRADFKGPVFLGKAAWAEKDGQGRFEVKWAGDSRPAIRGVFSS